MLYGWFKQKSFRCGLRWFLLFILMLVGLNQLTSMNLSWPRSGDSAFYLVGVFLGAFLAHGVQSAMTMEIVRWNGKAMLWKHALALNCLGGLWGLMMPLGSVGYKGLALKQMWGISTKDYVAYYGIAFMANLWMGLIFAIWPMSVMFGSSWAWGMIIVLLPLPLALLKAPTCLNRWGLLPQSLLSSVEKLRCFLCFAGIQGFGLGIYVGIYAAALSWFDAPWSFAMLFAFVVIQSWLFLAPLVPGNLVVLEGAGVWCFQQQGVAPEVALSVIALMRLSLLVELLIMAPWARFVLPSWNLLSQLENKN